VLHFYEMHDEGFLCDGMLFSQTTRDPSSARRRTLNVNQENQKGKVRFHSPRRPDVDAEAGEMVVVPICLPLRFSNCYESGIGRRALGMRRFHLPPFDPSGPYIP
jgi:hypothetical protein